ncbi:flavin reductase family protein [Enterovirga rhinocerotis]|uniref:Flavin reductase (DIM6/NTAB) family NADH-FMN oxidoreductase RutF n=1 Tax=Enterovirga rhinocerotis TaxID=1339210 RepID=A0A4R7C5R5_9HYPH|nr:flavin reductase family protein [Enterovirga rhinocerotis]TDR93738.1 flavin reductase (DIM6/NTAB) family NADH-FMN oxidoreductase RutF [Enterovirga rhinocerotis]
MFYDAVANDHGLRHNPIKALIGPRPIGWITALSAKGELNLSPYSFFNMVGENPTIVAFSSTGYKDAVAFVDETKEFVCNLVTWDLREHMNLTAAPLPRGESEVAHAGLTTIPSRFVKPPRVAEAPAALECRLLQTIRLETVEGAAMDQYLVLGQVMGIFIDDRFVSDGMVDTAAMRPIMRGGYHDYFVATPETKFSMTRPTKA